MVKLLSSYINYTVGQYIVEPRKKFRKCLQSHIGMQLSSNFEYSINFRNIFNKLGSLIVRKNKSK